LWGWPEKILLKHESTWLKEGLSGKSGEWWLGVPFLVDGSDMKFGVTPAPSPWTIYDVQQ